MNVDTSEKRFETDIETYFLNNGYTKLINANTDSSIAGTSEMK